MKSNSSKYHELLEERFDLIELMAESDRELKDFLQPRIDRVHSVAINSVEKYLGNYSYEDRLAILGNELVWMLDRHLKFKGANNRDIVVEGTQFLQRSTHVLPAETVSLSDRAIGALVRSRLKSHKEEAFREKGLMATQLLAKIDKDIKRLEEEKQTILRASRDHKNSRR